MAARRRFLAAGLGGAAATVAPLLGSRAAASPRTTPTTGGDDTSESTDTTGGTGDTTTTVAPTTTLAPVKRPTAEDIEPLVFAQSIELAIRDLYDAAASAGVFGDDTISTISAIRENHEAYGQAISGLLGREAPNKRNDAFFDEQQANFAGSEADVVAAAAAVENIAVATHLDLVDSLVGVDGSALIASILVVEARHATVLNTMAGAGSLDEQLASEADALAAADYPE